jgi:hypothetical protein
MTKGPQSGPGIQMVPSGCVAPANLLRLHILFEIPPDVDLAVSSARLLDARGDEIVHAFLDLPGGLWSADGLRLTLILHPGRIKSGLAAQSAAGAAVTAGRSYRVEIDGGDGPVQLPLVVGPAVTTAIDPTAWLVSTPLVASMDPLVVQFDRVMDPVGVEVGLSVRDQLRDSIEGVWLVSKDGRSARFSPAEAWRDSQIALKVASDLEDISGNRLNAAFEIKRAA